MAGRLGGNGSGDVRGSTIQHNYGYGVYGTRTAWAAAFRGNLLAHNGYGQVSVDGFRAARFDHNRIVSDVSDGLDLYGVDTTAVVSLLGDSIATLSYGDPLYVSPFDSLTLDSAVVAGPGG